MGPKEKKAVESIYAYSLYFASGNLARQIEKLAKNIWKPSGLHPSHAHVLQLILEYSMTFPTFLSKELLMSPSTITRLLEKLEKKELITRTPYDKLMVVEPTDKARELELLLAQCEDTFARLCEELLGDQKADELAFALSKATDLIANKAPVIRSAGSGQPPPQHIGKPFL